MFGRRRSLSKEGIFTLRSDGEGSRHVKKKKKKKNVPDLWNSMFPDKRKSVAGYRNPKKATTGAYEQGRVE